MSEKIEDNKIAPFLFPLSLWKFSAAVVVASALMIAAYMFNFATGTPRFSRDPGDWGVFGDYIGGTLGTFFAFAAFVGVLVTVAIQREHLKHARAQAYLNELQRFLSNTAERIDVMLNREIEVERVLLPKRFTNINRRVTLFSLIAGVGYARAGIIDIGDVDQQALLAASEAINTELPLLAGDLEYMAICMRTYQQRGGDSDIVKLYRLRYNPIVAWLYIADLARNETIISQFPVEEFVEQMKRLREARGATAAPQS